MGWASADKELVEELKKEVGLARQRVYILQQKIAQIRHNEKANILRRLSEETYAKLDEIDFQLSR